MTDTVVDASTEHIGSAISGAVSSAADGAVGSLIDALAQRADHRCQLWGNRHRLFSYTPVVKDEAATSQTAPPRLWCSWFRLRVSVDGTLVMLHQHHLMQRYLTCGLRWAHGWSLLGLFALPLYVLDVVAYVLYTDYSSIISILDFVDSACVNVMFFPVFQIWLAYWFRHKFRSFFVEQLGARVWVTRFMIRPRVPHTFVFLRVLPYFAIGASIVLFGVLCGINVPSALAQTDPREVLYAKMLGYRVLSAVGSAFAVQTIAAAVFIFVLNMWTMWMLAKQFNERLTFALMPEAQFDELRERIRTKEAKLVVRLRRSPPGDESSEYSESFCVGRARKTPKTAPATSQTKPLDSMSPPTTPATPQTKFARPPTAPSHGRVTIVQQARLRKIRSGWMESDAAEFSGVDPRSDANDAPVPTTATVQFRDHAEGDVYAECDQFEAEQRRNHPNGIIASVGPPNCDVCNVEYPCYFASERKKMPLSEAQRRPMSRWRKPRQFIAAEPPQLVAVDEPQIIGQEQDDVFRAPELTTDVRKETEHVDSIVRHHRNMMSLFATASSAIQAVVLVAVITALFAFGIRLLFFLGGRTYPLLMSRIGQALLIALNAFVIVMVVLGYAVVNRESEESAGIVHRYERYQVSVRSWLSAYFAENLLQARFFVFAPTMTAVSATVAAWVISLVLAYGSQLVALITQAAAA